MIQDIQRKRQVALGRNVSEEPRDASLGWKLHTRGKGAQKGGLWTAWQRKRCGMFREMQVIWVRWKRSVFRESWRACWKARHLAVVKEVNLCFCGQRSHHRLQVWIIQPLTHEMLRNERTQELPSDTNQSYWEKRQDLGKFSLQLVRVKDTWFYIQLLTNCISQQNNSVVLSHLICKMANVSVRWYLRII